MAALGINGDGKGFMDENIRVIDSYLEEYQSIHNMFDAWLVLAVDDISVVHKWRLQAEIKMREEGKPAMTDQQVTYWIIDRFSGLIDAVPF